MMEWWNDVYAHMKGEKKMPRLGKDFDLQFFAYNDELLETVYDLHSMISGADPEHKTEIVKTMLLARIAENLELIEEHLEKISEISDCVRYTKGIGAQLYISGSVNTYSD